MTFSIKTKRQAYWTQEQFHCPGHKLNIYMCHQRWPKSQRQEVQKPLVDGRIFPVLSSLKLQL
jgi:hypothetical protein